MKLNLIFCYQISHLFITIGLRHYQYFINFFKILMKTELMVETNINSLDASVTFSNVRYRVTAKLIFMLYKVTYTEEGAQHLEKRLCF